jgi:hypothetical protein
MSSVTPKTFGYQAAHWVYEKLPNKVASTVARLGGNTSTAKGWGNFFKQQLDNDFCEFAKAEVNGRFKTLIAEPPRGALLFLLYPCTVGPRLYRAYQRGRKENDYREVGDVLRRDLTAITFFVFALAPIVKGLSKVVENVSKVNLLDKNSGQVLRYSQFRNYELDTPHVLKAILAEGNGQGLRSAVENLSAKASGKDTDLAKIIQKIRTAVCGVKDPVTGKTKVPGLVEAYENALAKQDSKLPLHIRAKQALASIDNIDNVAEDIIRNFKSADALREGLEETARQAGATKLAGAAKNMQGEFTGALKKYAKVRRLPSDVVSFLAVVGLIGWFPVWFNSVWNKRQFEKEKAAKEAAQNAQPAIRPLPFNSFRSHSPYQPPQGMPYTMAPYGANPFARH